MTSQEIVARYVAGETLRQLSKASGRDIGRVYDAVKKSRVSMRGHIPASRRKAIDWKQVEQQLKNNCDMHEIAAEIGISRDTLARQVYLKKMASIPKRNPSLGREAAALYLDGYSLRLSAILLGCTAATIRRAWAKTGTTAKSLAEKRPPVTVIQKRRRGERNKKELNLLIEAQTRRRAKLRGLGVFREHAIITGQKFLYAEFPDVEALGILASAARQTKRHKGIAKHHVKRFVKTFYNNIKFKKCLETWRESGRAEWALPTMDHKIPVSRGGQHVASNIQFISRIENRMKHDWTVAEWRRFRRDHNLMASFLDEA